MGACGLFCSARVISLLGSAMAVVALPLAVLDHGTALDSGLVLAARLVAYHEFGSYLATRSAPSPRRWSPRRSATLAALIPLPSLLAQRHAAREPERQRA